MGRLDCKEPSHLALTYLAREADYFVTLTDQEVSVTLDQLQSYGLNTSPSGAAGISALFHGAEHLGLTSGSHALAYITEATA